MARRRLAARLPCASALISWLGALGFARLSRQFFGSLDVARLSIRGVTASNARTRSVDDFQRISFKF